MYQPTARERAFAMHIWRVSDEVNLKRKLKDALPKFRSFYFDDMWDIAMQALDHCVGGKLGYVESPAEYGDDWESQRDAMQHAFMGVWEEARANLLAKFEEAGDRRAFAEEHPCITLSDDSSIAAVLFDQVGGEVGDPWGIGIAEAWLEEMTKFKVFVLWYAAYEAAMGAVEEYLTSWVDRHGCRSAEPAEKAQVAFSRALVRLDSWWSTPEAMAA